MKKLLSVFALGCFLLSSSCMKTDPNNGKAPYDPGLSIYNATNQQSQVTLDLFNIMERLSVLLFEAQKSSSLDNLNDVMIQINKVDFSLSQLMFKNGSLSWVAGSNRTKIQIVYSTQYPSDDIAREGTLIIDMLDGKFMHESGARWTISIASDTFRIGQIASTSKSMVEIEGWDNCELENINNSSWELTIEGFKGYLNSLFKSDWDISYSITSSYISEPSNDNWTAKDCIMSGEASGLTMYGAKKYKFNTLTPLKYNRKCGILPIEGKIYAEFPEALEVDPEYYPSKFTIINWQLGDGCNSHIYIEYNDIVYKYK